MNRKILIGISSILLILVASNWWWNSNGNYESIPVVRRTLLQEVRVSGTVVAADKASLAFERNGKITSIAVQEGQEVQKGDSLIILDSTQVLAELAQAQARLQSEIAQSGQLTAGIENQEALLDELKKGTRQEEINISKDEVELKKQQLKDNKELLQEEKEVSQSKLQQAEKKLSDARNKLSTLINENETELANLYDDIGNLMNSTYAIANGAIRNKTSDVFRSNTYNVHEVVFDSFDQTFENLIENQRAQAINALNTWKTLNETLNNTNHENLIAALQSALKATEIMRTFLLNTSSYVNNPNLENENNIFSIKTQINEAKDNINQVREDLKDLQQSISNKIAQDQNSISTAEELVNAAISNLELVKKTNQQSIKTAESNVNTTQQSAQKAESELQLKAVGSREESITAQEARVKEEKARLNVQYARIQEARAEVQRLQAELDKTTMKAPINGIVTSIEVEAGEIVSSNEVILSLISPERYEIEANIPEINIAKIRTQQQAEITLDAYGEEKFPATVQQINPAETIVEGVTNYEITLQFDQQDERILSGMTANIRIITDKRVDELSLPNYSIEREGDLFFVLKNRGKNDPIRIPVESSFASTDGYRSIDNGLEEGDEVLIPAK